MGPTAYIQSFAGHRRTNAIVNGHSLYRNLARKCPQDRVAFLLPGCAIRTVLLLSAQGKYACLRVFSIHPKFSVLCIHGHVL